MSDNSAARSRSTNIEINVPSRYAKSRSKSRDIKEISDQSSNGSASDIKILRQDIINLIQLANQINDKIIRSRMNLTASFSGDDEMISTVKCITESFHSISLFIKEDNINMTDVPEFSELSLKISRLRLMISENQNSASTKELLYETNKQEFRKLEIGETQEQGDSDIRGIIAVSKPSGSSINCINENDMSIRNMVMNEVFLEEDDIMGHMDLRTPLIEKDEFYSPNSNNQNQYLQQYSQNIQKYGTDPYKSQDQTSKIETIGISIFLALLILVVILYIVS